MHLLTFETMGCTTAIKERCWIGSLKLGPSSIFCGRIVVASAAEEEAIIAVLGLLVLGVLFPLLFLLLVDVQVLYCFLKFLLQLLSSLEN